MQMMTWFHASGQTDDILQIARCGAHLCTHGTGAHRYRHTDLYIVTDETDHPVHVSQWNGQLASTLSALSKPRFKLESICVLFHWCSHQMTQLLTYLFTDMCYAHWQLYLLCVVIKVWYFGGWGPKGPMTLKFELGREFLTVTSVHTHYNFLDMPHT